jgi:hypothetical protein
LLKTRKWSKISKKKLKYKNLEEEQLFKGENLNPVFNKEWFNLNNNVDVKKIILNKNPKIFVTN